MSEITDTFAAAYARAVRPTTCVYCDQRIWATVLPSGRSAFTADDGWGAICGTSPSDEHEIERRYDPYDDDGRCPRVDCTLLRAHTTAHLDPDGYYFD